MQAIFFIWSHDKKNIQEYKLLMTQPWKRVTFGRQRQKEATWRETEKCGVQLWEQDIERSFHRDHRLPNLMEELGVKKMVH